MKNEQWTMNDEPLKMDNEKWTMKTMTNEKR